MVLNVLCFLLSHDTKGSKAQHGEVIVFFLLFSQLSIDTRETKLVV
jgi:hypothetical protein